MQKDKQNKESLWQLIQRSWKRQTSGENHTRAVRGQGPSTQVYRVILSEGKKGMDSFFRKEDDIVSLCLKMYNCHQFVDFPLHALTKNSERNHCITGILKLGLKKKKRKTQNQPFDSPRYKFHTSVLWLRVYLIGAIHINNEVVLICCTEKWMKDQEILSNISCDPNLEGSPGMTND